MPIYTNHHDLPDYLAKWLKFDDYDYIEGVVSATGLLSSARQTVLKERHNDEMELDVSEFIARRVGTAIHNSFEEVPMSGIEKENRVICEIDGRNISGKYDMLKQFTKDLHRIIDIKTTSVYKYIYGSSLDEWKTQLSIYKYILEHNGWTVVDGEWEERKAIKVDTTAEVCFVFTDWQKRDVGNVRNYPDLKVGNMEIRLFKEDIIEDFIIERLNMFDEARELEDDDLPFCDDEELWKKPDKWAVIGEGNVKATKIFDTDVAAKIHAEHLSDSKNKTYNVEHRPGLVMACNYCDPRCFCNQRPILIDSGVLEVS